MDFIPCYIEWIMHRKEEIDILMSNVCTRLYHKVEGLKMIKHKTKEVESEICCIEKIVNEINAYIKEYNSI